MTIEVKTSQLEKTEPPIAVTLSGIVIEGKASQLLKAYAFIVFTPLPIVTEVKFVQFSKAEVPIKEMLSGMTTEVRPAQ